MNECKTICMNCKHIDRSHVLFYRCNHPEITEQLIQDPVTGEMRYPLGAQYKCQDINTGDCKLYEDKPVRDPIRDFMLRLQEKLTR